MSGQAADTGEDPPTSPSPAPPSIPNIPPRVASPLGDASSNFAPQSPGEVQAGEARRAWRRQQAAHEGLSPPAQGSSRPSSTAPIEDSEVPTPTNPADLDSVPISDEQKARIIDRHLNLPDTSGIVFPSASDAGEGDDSVMQAASMSRFSTHSAGGTPNDGEPAASDVEYFAAHHTQGGAITDDIYRWAHQNRRKATRRTRSESVHLPRTETIDPDLDVEGIKEPGGFRRFFLLNQANRQGQPPPRALRSFIDFLSLYGHFAGEELEDIEDEDEEDQEADEETGLGVPSTSRGCAAGGATERSPLLRRQSTRRRNRSATGAGDGSEGERGEASVTEAVMMLLKSFVGTGILFLGKAFLNGGLLFSSIVLCAVALISLKSFLLLVQANLRVPASFGDMGGKLYGPKMRLAILTSIVFSQLGFVAAYTVFVAQNLQAFVLGVTHGQTRISTAWFIIMQCAIFVPLSLVRKIAKLSSTALVADVFILAGIIYLYQYEIGHVLERGIADVKQFNSESFPLFVGTAVFTFEGVGLVIPITESMKEPHKFPKVLSAVMVAVMVLFTSSGALSYMAFGSKTQTVVMTNLPQGDKFVQASLFLYAIAILFSVPLQLYPALQILERGIFSTRSGKYSPKVKLEKNLFRAATVVVSCFAAWAGSSQLDVFVSFIGAVFCCPLCFLFPPLLSLKAMPDRSWASKSIDVAIFIFGLAAVLFAGSQTVGQLFTGPKQA
ncbi:unnamed protein product [Parajaminaea phylloscopi]